MYRVVWHQLHQRNRLSHGRPPTLVWSFFSRPQHKEEESSAPQRKGGNAAAPLKKKRKGKAAPPKKRLSLPRFFSLFCLIFPLFLFCPLSGYLAGSKNRISKTKSPISDKFLAPYFSTVFASFFLRNFIFPRFHVFSVFLSRFSSFFIFLNFPCFHVFPFSFLHFCFFCSCLFTFL